MLPELRREGARVATVIQINGKRFEFIGSPDDFYFKNLETFHKQGDVKLLRYLATLKPDAVSLDIGANIGLTALAIEAFTPAGKVYAFEPSPNNLPYLRANVQANGSRVQVVGAAVGDRQGAVSLSLPATGAHSSIIRGGATEGKNAATVPMIAIDEWMRLMGTSDGLDFVKIDVESFEAQVISGAARTIVALRPYILMEFNSVAIACSSRISPLVFAEALESVFELYDVAEEGKLVPLGNGSIHNFVHMNMVQHGCVDDIIMRVRGGLAPSDVVSAMAL
jgi:FkbM family methyltransferase